MGYKESYGATCAAGMDVQLDSEAQCQQREINYELSEQTILEHKEDFFRNFVGCLSNRGMEGIF